MKNTSLSSYAIEILEEGLKADKIGASLGDAIEAYRMREIHKGAGSVIIPRGSLLQIIISLGEEHKQDLEKLWAEAGGWYGKYLAGKLRQDEVLPFLRQDLLTSWNLDEVEISEGEEVILRFTGFSMSDEFTGLLLKYIGGIMDSLGLREVERDSLRGMATIKYLNLK